jgi:hypothetical protein
LAPFIQGLYARPDLVPYLYTDRAPDDHTGGHTTQSRGFKAKMLDNPAMNQEHRNLGLVATASTVNFFADQAGTAWAFRIRVANLPAQLSTHVANIHLHLLVANATEEQPANRDAKSLHPYLAIIADDLLGGYATGKRWMFLPYLRIQLCQHIYNFLDICTHMFDIFADVYDINTYMFDMFTYVSDMCT